MATVPNKAAFLNLLNDHKGIIYKIANAYGHHPQDREDLVQEIMLQAWRSFPRYDPTYKVSTWLYRIALNVSISWWRKKEVRQKREVALEDQLEQGGEDTSLTADKEATLQLLHRFIGDLKALDKALMLLYLEEKSYEEIAEILHISKTNVATKISRIKQKLKQRFAAQKEN